MTSFIDMHTHTFLSNCSHDQTANAASFLEKAAETGIGILGITNHGWDAAVPGASKFYQTQPIEHVLKIRGEIPEKHEGVRLLIGIETEYRGMCDTLGITAESAAKFDYILVPHSHTHMIDFVMPADRFYLAAKDEMRAKLRAAFPEVSDAQIDVWMQNARKPDVKIYVKERDLAFLAEFLCASFEGLLRNEELQKCRERVPVIVAHPFLACGYTEEEADAALAMIPDGRFRALFSLMAEKGVGYDVSVNAFLSDGGEEHPAQFRLLKLARESGVKFIFGTDSHSVAALSRAWKSAEIFRRADLTENDLHPLCRATARG